MALTHMFEISYDKTIPRMYTSGSFTGQDLAAQEPDYRGVGIAKKVEPDSSTIERTKCST